MVRDCERSDKFSGVPSRPRRLLRGRHHLHPAGTFATTGLGVGYQHPNRTIRGAGTSATILRHVGSTGLVIGDGTDPGSSFNPTTTVTAMTRGSNVITVASGAAMWSGGRPIARLYLANEIVTPIVSVAGYTGIRSPIVCITGRSGNNLTLSQPLPSGFAAALAAGTCRITHVSQLGRGSSGIGIEDLTIDGVNATSSVFTTIIQWAENSWFKNVKVINPGNYAVFVTDTVNCEIRHCVIDSVSGGSNRAGLLMLQSSYALVEDNIFTNGGPDVEINASNTNCVIAYNVGGVFNGNHGPHNSYNLWGRKLHPLLPSGWLLWRRLRGDTVPQLVPLGVTASLKRFTRNFNYIGNLVGTVGQTYANDYSQRWGDPNLGNESSTGTAQFSTGNYWPDWDSVTNAPRVLRGNAHHADRQQHWRHHPRHRRWRASGSGKHRKRGQHPKWCRPYLHDGS